MKRCMSLVLILLLLVSVTSTAGAAGTPTLSVSSGSAKAGETVTLTISIKDNPGIAATLLYVYYDTAAFTVNPDENIQGNGAFQSKGSIIGNSISSAKENGRYDGDADKDGLVLLWYNASGQDITSNGKLCTIQFLVNQDAANGDHTVQVAYSGKDTSNRAGESISFQVSPGTITVSGGSDAKTPVVPTDIPEVPTFADISGNWAENQIMEAAQLGLVEGYDGKYRPNDSMTRAEFVTILWRSEGSPAPKGTASFTDLTRDWYKDAVAWAEENKVVDGVGEGRFAPTRNVTREQLVTILHRLAGKPMGMELMLTSAYDNQYSDSGRISSWAKQALYWSIYEGIYCGEASQSIGTTLAPKANATRAQIAVMMTRYLDD